MPRADVFSLLGLRSDGRRANQMRRVSAKTGVLPQAEGSAYIEMGNTKVFAAVYGPCECRVKSQALHDRALLNVDFTQASFALTERRRTRRLDRKNLEVQVQIRDTLESVIMTTLYPRSQISVFLQVMQADGGQVQACINAASLALVNAGIAMKDYVVACTVGNHNGTPLIDLNQSEVSNGVPEITVAMLPRTEEIVLIQMESRLHADKLEPTMELALVGCKQLHKELDRVVFNDLKSAVRKCV